LRQEGIPTLLAPEPLGKSAASTAGSTPPAAANLDVVFPVLHGTFGEDGTIQGLFELAGIAYVGSGVLGSAAGMDKDVMKRLFADARLPIVKHITLLRAEWEQTPRKAIARIEAALKYPLFVKPANLGSSVGISKAHDRKELGPALTEAAKFDRKLVVEQGVGGNKAKARELEVAVLGNDDPKASVVGEIVPGKEFYDYEAKYLSEGSVPVIPAKLTRAETKQIREMAVAAFRACDLSGLARVDFLMEPDGKRRIYLNEVNTMPGFTQISMYPKLWAATGLPYTELLTRLIELGLERYGEKKRTIYSRE
jgi:D-alanine-D-alanine ligase